MKCVDACGGSPPWGRFPCTRRRGAAATAEFLVRVVISAVTVACAERSTAGLSVDAEAKAVSPPEEVEARTLTPLQASSWIDDLGDGVKVALPLGATGPRPILVGVHGAEDHPGYACGEWTSATAGFAFVVCPHGLRARDVYVWQSPEAIATSAENAIARVRQRFGAYVSPGPAIYGGFSQGASLAAHVMQLRPHLFDRAVLVEHGHTPLAAAAVAETMRHIHGLILACSTAGCDRWTHAALPELTRRRVRLRIAIAGHYCHCYDDRLARAISANLPWLVEDDSRWRGLGEHLTHHYVESDSR